MTRSFLLATLIAVAAGAASAQAPDLSDAHARAAVAHLQSQAGALGLLPADAADLYAADGHVSTPSGVSYAYVRQRLDGLDVVGAQVTVALTREGRVFHTAGGLRAGLARAAAVRTAALGPVEAVQAAASAVGASLPTLAVVESKSGAARETVLDAGPATVSEPRARLVYLPVADGTLRLAWEVQLWPRRGASLWLLHVDAATGAELARQDLTISCTWGDGESAEAHGAHGSVSLAPLARRADAPNALLPLVGALGGPTYRVFAAPDESPNHGLQARTLVSGVESPTASPFGWHDTNGVAGAEFTTTRGNNTHAYLDRDDDEAPDVGGEADGGAGLSFDFALDFALQPTQYIDASVTNLFYWSNVFHDIMHAYGFDEPAGNFQANNYGNGGTGSDAVDSESQSGADICNEVNPCVNNANFATPPEGQRPRMQMYVGNQLSPMIDGSFDAGVIVHEYGHGVSTRLTGGAATSSCLNNSEQMGEGWSDWYGLMVTMQPTHTRTTSRGIGTYLFGQAPTGPGIRPAPYNTNFAANNYTYQRTRSGLSVPHGIGFVWATALWEMTWDLIDAHGFDPDVYDAAGTAGNQIAMNLVTEALKLQPCNPGFVSGRDAILAADAALYPDVANPGRGLHYALLWDAFARRGLGFSATQGSTSSNTDNTEAFDTPLPPALANVSPGSIEAVVPAGGSTTVDVTLSNTALSGSQSLSYTAAVVGGNVRVAGRVTAPADRPSGEITVERLAGALADAGKPAEIVEPAPVARAAAALAGGGPDAFGYTWQDSSEPGGPPVQWTDISATGTAISLGDDAASGSIALPFPFPFYGQDKTSLFIVSNGFLALGASSTALTNAAIPTAAVPNDIVAPFWDDLHPSVSGYGSTIHYLAAPDRFVVQYTNVPRYDDRATAGRGNSFQAILYPDGTVEYQYQTMNATSLTSASVGIEDAAGAVGLQMAFNQAFLASNKAVRISPPLTWASVAPASGTVAPGANTTLTVTLDAADLTEGTYTADLVIASNAQGGTVTLPITLTVTGNTTVTGGPGWRLLAAPAPGITVDDLAALNLVQGVPGYYPQAQPNLYTAYDGAAYTPSSGTGEALALGRGFWWYLYDQDLTPGGPSNSVALPMTLATANLPTTADARVPLHGNGWNMLGNPFGTSLDVSGVAGWTGAGDLSSVVLHAWDAAISGYRTSVTNPVFASWQGFFAEDVAAGTVSIPASARTAGGTLMRSAEPSPMLAFELAAADGPQRDVAAVLRLHADASDGRDVYDASKLEPASSSFVSLGFGGAEGLRAVESRSPEASSFTVPLHVASVGAGTALELTWPTATLPEAWTLTLRDLVTGETVDLRTQSRYAFTVAPEATRRAADAAPNARTLAPAGAARFELVVETGRVVAEEGGETSALALDAPRPNPAAGQTRVGFALAAPGAVRLTVVDVQGREVAVLLDEERPAGAGSALLDASALASGVYVVRLDAAGERLTQRLAIVR